MGSSNRYGARSSAEDAHVRKRAGGRKFAPPLYKAEMRLEATSHTKERSTSTAINPKIIHRIKSCLARGRHQAASEFEAKTAMHMATRLVTQYHTSIADIDAHGTSPARDQGHGHSIVALVRRDGDLDKIVRQSIYVHDLARAINLEFKVEGFTRSGSRSVEVTFYGLAMNTIAAANAFEMVFNRMEDWAQYYQSGNIRNSYCIGVCERLESSARREQRDEERSSWDFDSNRPEYRTNDSDESQQDEQYEEANFDEDHIDLAMDIDEIIRTNVSRLWAQFSGSFLSTKAKYQATGAVSPNQASHLHSHGQLVTHRNNAKKACDDWLKHHNIKMRIGRSRSFNFDSNAYDDGLEDGKHIKP